jgi:hypothetical protein
MVDAISGRVSDRTAGFPHAEGQGLPQETSKPVVFSAASSFEQGAHHRYKACI